ncbi:hypothetical protein VTI74DRAFT_7487 [Chaetomium olivicolor]
MAPGTRRSLLSFLMANDAQLRKRYRRHCRRDRCPLRHRSRTRSCMVCFIARGRISAIAESTRRVECAIQDSADSETSQMEQEERQTCLREEPEGPPPPECELGICDTGYNTFGEPLYCRCEGDGTELIDVWNAFVHSLKGNTLKDDEIVMLFSELRHPNKTS